MLRRTIAFTSVLLLLLSSFLSLAVVSPAESSFSEDVLVSGYEPSQEDQRNPRIAAAPDGNISVVWEEDTDGLHRVFHSLSQDGGATWSVKTVVNASQPWEQGSPALAVDDNGTIYVAWAAEAPSGPQVFVAHSNDSGASFSGAVEVSAQTSGAQMHPDMALANDVLYITWAEENSSHLDIYLARSLDGGENFQSALRVDDSEGLTIQNFPSVAAREGTVFVVWHDGREDQYLDIYGAWSNDSGVSFGPNIKVSDGPTGARESQADVSLLPDGSAVVVWQEDRQLTGDFDIRAAVCDGLMSLPSVRVDDVEGEGNSTNPSVTCDDGGNISVTFTDDRTGHNHIYFVISRDGGRSFTTDIRVDHSPDEILAQGSSDLCVGVDGTPLVVFEDIRFGKWTIFFSYMINEPPECEILSPVEGETLQGIVNITGLSHDPDGNDSLLVTTIRVSGVDYDSGWIIVEGAEWWFPFNASALINGDYLFQARCYDGRAYSQLAQASVHVLNADQPWPDLTLSPSDITFTPDEMEAGMLVAIHAKVTNTGNITANDVEVRFYRGMVEIGSDTVGSIPSGGNATASSQWMTLQGVHTIVVEIDPEDQIQELEEGNNQATTQINVRSVGYYRPDLEITLADVSLSPDEPKEGNEVNVTVEVWNTGRVDASQVKVKLLMDELPLDEKVLDVVPLNGSVLAEFDWTAEAGDHQLTLIVDPENTTDELDEGNNNLTLPLQVELVEAFPGWYLAAGVAIAFIVAAGIVALMRRGARKR